MIGFALSPIIVLQTENLSHLKTFWPFFGPPLLGL
jgi:hypothetical protein